jgi:hypothetical protein
MKAASNTCMAKSLFVIAAVLVPILPGLSAQTRNEGQHQTKQTAVWAGITVQQPIFAEDGIDVLQMKFGVFNDGTSTINPNVESSHLFINGVEPEDWPTLRINGLRTPQFFSLPPGEWLDFGMSLGRYFRRPGVYRVRWEGDNFKTAELTFRVVPGDL